MLHQIHTCIIKWVLFCHPMKLVVAIRLEISSRMLPQCLSAKRRSWRWWTLWAYCDDKRSSGLIISWHSNIRTFSSKGTISITGYVNNYNQGLKLSFCQTCQWPVTSSNLPLLNLKYFFYRPWNYFCKNRQVITTTITKHIAKVLISPLLTRKIKDLLISFFLVPKIHWDSRSANGAGHRVTPVLHILSLQCECGANYFHTHINGLEQGYAISFIWGSYRTENLKGAKGVGAVPISIGGDLLKCEIKLKFIKVNVNDFCQSIKKINHNFFCN